MSVPTHRGGLVRSFTVMACLVAAVVVAATLGTAGNARGATVSGNLRIMWETSQRPTFSVMVAAFKRRYPNVNVTEQYVPFNTYRPVVDTQFAAGQGPDIFWTRSAASTIGGIHTYAREGQVAPLKGSYLKNIVPSVKASLTYKGKVYGWMGDIYAQGYFYNKNQFKEAGIKRPTTLAQMLEACKKFRARGVSAPLNLAAAGASASYGPTLMLQLARHYVYNKDPKWNDKRAKGRVKFATSKGWQKALSKYAEFKNAGCFGAAPQGVSTQQSVADFAAGRSPMALLAGLNYAGIKALNPKFSIGQSIMPADRAKDTKFALNEGAIWSINADTKNMAAAQAFVAFTAEPRISRQYGKISGTISPYDYRSGRLPAMFDSQSRSLFRKKKVIGQVNAAWTKPEVYGLAVPQGIQGILTGQRTGRDLLEAMDKAWDGR